MKNINLNDVKVIFLTQSAGETVYELVQDTSKKMGKTIFITGSDFSSGDSNLYIQRAPRYNNSSLFSRLVSWTAFFFSALLRMRSISGSPVLVITSNPPILPLLGSLFKKLRSWKYIVWVLDVYPDVLVQNNLVREKNLLYKTWSRVNSYMYREAEYVITLGEVMSQRLMKYSVKRDKLRILPNWVNVFQYYPIFKESNIFARKYTKFSNLNVMYSGNLGLTHDIHTVFAGIKMLEKNDGISFFIIGGGVENWK